MIVCGCDLFNQLGASPNNKDDEGDPIISPPVEITANPISILCYTIYSGCTIIIYEDNTTITIGNNRDGQISGTLPKEVIERFTKFELKDSKGRQYKVISSVCCGNYILYLVENPDDSSKNQIIYPSHNSPIPEIINTYDSNPIALYGGIDSAASIDSEGRIIFIPHFSLPVSTKSYEFHPQSLPNGEKADNIACCYNNIICLSASGRVFISAIENKKIELNFKEVDELAGIQIVDISGTASHCLAVTNDYRVFGFGDNDFGQLGLGRLKKEAKKFTEISSLKKEKIDLAFAGTNHSLFITLDNRVLACGLNNNGQLPINEKIGKKKKIFTPVESIFKNGKHYCIAGSFLSVFFDLRNIPKKSPNKSISRFYH